MSTRSRIGIQDADGSIRSVYCHSDGYLSGVGDTLINHYADPEKVEALIALGDLSCLGEEIGEAHDFDEPRWGFQQGYNAERAAQIKNWTVSYHRDRKEPLRIEKSPTEADYLKAAEASWGEYVYLLRDGQWLVHSYPGREYGNGGFQPVVDAIAAENEADEAA
ncbi:hypothetical protein [Sphingobium sp. YC-XJ3]|uniref:hypothetical protein n=1 Tax=Sphingobium sp. YC-XJ3 TaxID=3024245 RepID=UPI002360FD50|nr:hypothetical protein [Sphingobium sp. YC-XJ3]WDA36427.1 hypothetical protein PO876_23860 [Sphingobium sp. YC-XJ3]